MYIAFLNEKSLETGRKKYTKNKFSCIFMQKTANILEQLAKGHCIFTVSLLLKILYKFYFPGESHQIW